MDKTFYCRLYLVRLGKHISNTNLAGTKGKYIEIGGGATYAPGLNLFDDLNERNVYGTMSIGFRKQPVGKKGFTFRAAFMPLIGFDAGGSFLPFAGVSWGYRF